jgi:uncharacterized protein (DUF305 family)
MEHAQRTMQHQEHQDMQGKHYGKLIAMAVLSFISMYILMYAMVDKLSNVYTNINQFYMAGLMTMPMIIIEVVLMRSMYMNKKLNAGIIIVSALALIGFFLCIRQQTAVSERQFLRGMIPHHAAAILMSKKNPAKDPEIVKLQQEIISSQEREIAEMKAILERMKKE